MDNYEDKESMSRQSYRALEKIISSLTGSLKNPNLAETDRNTLQEALETALSYIERIKQLFDGFGGIH